MTLIAAYLKECYQNDIKPTAKLMAKKHSANRPLSPHLTIYRPQLNSITSIFARITGNALIVAVLMIVWWLVAAASGPAYFSCADAVLRSWLGQSILGLSLWALWYHFCAGLRHLIWDTGAGFSLKSATWLGWSVVIGSFILTGLTIIIL